MEAPPIQAGNSMMTCSCSSFALFMEPRQFTRKLAPCGTLLANVICYHGARQFRQGTACETPDGVAAIVALMEPRQFSRETLGAPILSSDGVQLQWSPQFSRGNHLSRLVVESGFTLQWSPPIQAGKLLCSSKGIGCGKCASMDPRHSAGTTKRPGAAKIEAKASMEPRNSGREPRRPAAEPAALSFNEPANSRQGTGIYRRRSARPHNASMEPPNSGRETAYCTRSR